MEKGKQSYFLVCEGKRTKRKGKKETMDMGFMKSHALGSLNNSSYAEKSRHLVLITTLKYPNVSPDFDISVNGNWEKGK